MLAQLSQYLYAGRLRQVPIDHGKVGIDRGGKRAKQRRAIGESVNDKALAQQLDGQDLTIVLVTFDENDAANFSFADGRQRCRSGRRERVVLPETDRPIPLVRSDHDWQSVWTSHRGVSTPKAGIKLAHHPLSLLFHP